MPSNILLAFDKFKDSMTAQAATRRAHRCIEKHWPGTTIHAAPLTDGGEGFCEILTAQVGGILESHPQSGPRFETLEAQIGYVAASDLPKAAFSLLDLPKTVEKIAVIEMAQAAGIQSVPIGERDAHKTTTLGVGQQIRRAIDSRADAILLGVGGSATSDCGIGALEALSFEFLDASGNSLEKITPSMFPKIATVQPPETLGDYPQIRIACDVNNPLLGPRGAAHVFGPQKGLKAEIIPSFDAEIGRIARLLCASCGQPETLMNTPGAGAAGGIAGGLLISLGAQLVPGFTLVRSWLGLDQALQDADFIVTGEGKWDLSSLDGKGPYSVIQAVAERPVDVLLVAGALEPEAIKPVRDRIHGQLDTIELRHPNKSLAENLAVGPERLSQLLEKFFSEKSL